MKSPLTFSAILCLATCTFAKADDKLAIKIEYKPGMTYHQTMQMDQTMTVPGQGEMLMTMGMDMKYVVEAVPEANMKTVSISYDAMRMKVTAGGKETVAIDSSNAESMNSPAAASLKPILAAKIKLTLSPNDKPLKVEGLEGLASNPMMAQMLSEDSMKNMFSQTTLMSLPKQPISKGETWEFSKSIPNPMLNISMAGKYTYQSDVTENGTKMSVLAVSGTMSLTPPSAAEEDAKNSEADDKMAQIKAQMKELGITLKDGQMTGTATYDPSINFVRKADINTDMTMTFNNPQGGGKIEMPTKQHVVMSVTKMELTKK